MSPVIHCMTYSSTTSLSVCLSVVCQVEGERLGEALESTVDAQEWRLEVERVLPALKIHVRQDNRVRQGHRGIQDD